MTFMYAKRTFNNDADRAKLVAETAGIHKDDVIAHELEVYLGELVGYQFYEWFENDDDISYDYDDDVHEVYRNSLQKLLDTVRAVIADRSTAEDELPDSEREDEIDEDSREYPSEYYMELLEAERKLRSWLALPEIWSFNFTL